MTTKGTEEGETARLNKVAGLYGNREYLRALRDKLDERWTYEVGRDSPGRVPTQMTHFTKED